MTKGERIKQLREKNDLSQVELAKKIGVSKQTLYKYENNIVTNIPSDKIEMMATIFGVDPGYIMGWKRQELLKSNNSLSLSLQDQTLLAKANQLNMDGREVLDDYLDMLLQKEKYTISKYEKTERLLG